MDSLKVIEQVVGKIAPGRTPSFTEAHVIKVLEIIDAKSLGRIRLSNELGLGEGITRTLAKHLKNNGLIEVSRSGIILSKLGIKVLSDLRSKISEAIEIPQNPLAVGAFNVAILARNVADMVRYGVEQRDAAIKAGALGATTLVFSHNELTMPSDREGVFETIQPIHEELMSQLELRENDVIVIGSADDRLEAEFGAKAAVLELLKRKKRH